MSAKTYQSTRPRFSPKKPSARVRPVRTTPRASARATRHISASIGWLVLLVAFLIALYVLIQHFFVVRRVSCILNLSSTPCSASLAATAQKLLGRPMLFADFQSLLESTRSAHTDFDYVTYYKLLPDRVVVDYHFPEPIYQIAIADGPWLGFALDQRYTIATGAADLLQIRSYYLPLNQQLAQFTSDDLLHQKFLELEFYSQGQRDQWQAVSLHSLNLLQIETPHAVYDVDPFDLDRNLQKLFYVEKNRRSEQKQEIDLRLHVPVVRDLLN